MLRLKRHKETNARRVLLRNSGNGKITLVCDHFLLSGTLLTLVLRISKSMPD